MDTDLSLELAVFFKSVEFLDSYLTLTLHPDQLIIRFWPDPFVMVVEEAYSTKTSVCSYKTTVYQNPEFHSRNVMQFVIHESF